jgi:hypothetical protein
MSVRDFVERLASGKPPAQEAEISPRNLVQLFESLAAQAHESAKAAATAASRNHAEAGRFVSDAAILKEAVGFYGNKIEAAIHKGLFDRLGREEDAQQMLTYLRQSVVHYRRLTDEGRAYSRPSDLNGVIGWSECW